MHEVLENTVLVVGIFKEAERHKELALKRVYIEKIATHTCS